MKLIYCFIGRFRNIINQEVCLSSDWDVHYNEGKLNIKQKAANEVLDYLYGNAKGSGDRYLNHLYTNKKWGGRTS